MSVGDAYLAMRLQQTFDRIELMDEKLDLILDTLGEFMATALEQLTALQAQISDTAADVLAKLEQLQTAAGNLTPDAQAILDDIKAQVGSLDTTVGDADGSDTANP
jgi:hypothetical protein